MNNNEYGDCDRTRTTALSITLAAIVLLTACGSALPKKSPEQDGAATDFDAQPSDADMTDVAPMDGGATDGEATDGEATLRGPCATSVDCPPGLTCIAGTCGRSRTGRPCGAGDQCASGFCEDGVCCNTACQDGCVSCNQPGRAGVCWPVDQGQPDPRGVCTDKGSASCGTTGACDGFGGCAKYSAGTTCAASTCVGNSFQGSRLCDGDGTCGQPPPLRACAPYACNPANCLNACVSDLSCAAPTVCVSGSCRLLPTIALAGSEASSELGGFYSDPTIDDLCPTGAAVIGYDVAATPDPTFPIVDRIRTVCAALRIPHSSPLAIAVGPTTSLDERGFGPGPVVQLRCPPNQVVTGFDGRSGTLVDQLTFHCAPLLISNTETPIALGGVTEVGPVGGNGGGASPAIECGPARVAVGTRTLADLFLRKFALLCATISLR